MRILSNSHQWVAALYFQTWKLTVFFGALYRHLTPHPTLLCSELAGQVSSLGGCTVKGCPYWQWFRLIFITHCITQIWKVLIMGQKCWSHPLPFCFRRCVPLLTSIYVNPMKTLLLSLSLEFLLYRNLQILKVMQDVAFFGIRHLTMQIM